MGKKAVSSDRAPGAIGPYSQAILASGTLWCSGQIGLDPATGQLTTDGFEAEARQVLRNLDAVLAAAGMTMADVVRLTVYLVDLVEFPKLNEIFAEVLPAPYPARATVQVSALPRSARVEIDLVATRAD